MEIDGLLKSQNHQSDMPILHMNHIMNHIMIYKHYTILQRTLTADSARFFFFQTNSNLNDINLEISNYLFVLSLDGMKAIAVCLGILVTVTLAAISTDNKTDGE